jgi:signal transduction histidine kinase
MQTTSNDHTPQEDPSPRKSTIHRRSLAHLRLQSPAFGYVACVLLVGVLVLIERIDQYFPHAPLFVGAPFALASVLVAMIWGIGPAVFSIVLGLGIIATFLSPNVFTPDVAKDLLIVGPFAFLQLGAVVVVMRLERSRRQILVAQQITERYAQELASANQQLKFINTQLEQAHILKDYILIRAAHELRTPLTTIRGRTQLLASRLEKTGETPESWAAVQRYIPVMEARTRHLQALIERLLDLGRAQSRAIPLQRYPCDLGKLCGETVEDQRVLSGRAIELTLPASSVVLQADSQLLSQVLTNLISNAVKYSPEQSSIQVCLCAEEKQGRVHVQNECPALQTEQVARFFEPFYRTPEVEYSPIPGWGLGLTISKEIVEQHGGQIWAEVSREKRITFFVTLPFLTGAE